MAVAVSLSGLPQMHPLLLWEPIIPAAFLVFQQRGMEPPYRFVMAIEDLPGFGTDMLELAIETPGISPLTIERCERTFEVSRLIEFAAIAIAGLTLHAAGGHELIDVARRGSAADYLRGCRPPSFGDSRPVASPRPGFRLAAKGAAPEGAK